MRKATGLQIAHKCVCGLYWIAWIVGAVLTGIFRFVPSYNTHDFLFDVVSPYMSIVMVFSVMIPVEPVLFVGILIQAIRKRLLEEKLVVHILFFVAHIILFFVCLVLFTVWTGGV